MESFLVLLLIVTGVTLYHLYPRRFTRFLKNFSKLKFLGIAFLFWGIQLAFFIAFPRLGDFFFKEKLNLLLGFNLILLITISAWLTKSRFLKAVSMIALLVFLSATYLYLYSYLEPLKLRFLGEMTKRLTQNNPVVGIDSEPNKHIPALADTLTTIPKTEKQAPDIPIKNVKVTALRFFEGDIDHMPIIDERVYRERFEKSKTRAIYYRIDLAHPAQGTRKDFAIDVVFHNPDGTTHKRTLNTFVEGDWLTSWRTWGWGWTTPGNWTVGYYEVQIFIGNKKMATGNFEIY